VQPFPAAEYDPAGHARHVDEPAAEPVPAGQDVQDPPLDEYVFYIGQLGHDMKSNDPSTYCGTGGA
jgi:hypothetical protein